MDHGLMTGMLIAGILMSIFPITLGIALWMVAVRLYRAERRGDG